MVLDFVFESGCLIVQFN